MAKKYYAVKAGRQTGLFTSWDDCKAQVQGFSGAIYKSFPSLVEAQQYLWGEPSAAVQSAAVAQTAEQDMVAYVDGSFHLAKKMFAYGAVIFYQGEEYHFKGSDNDAELVEMRNVAGEIQGAERAMAFALEQGAAVLHIIMIMKALPAGVPVSGRPKSREHSGIANIISRFAKRG